MSYTIVLTVLHSVANTVKPIACDIHSIWSKCCSSYHDNVTMFTPNRVAVTSSFLQWSELAIFCGAINVQTLQRLYVYCVYIIKFNMQGKFGNNIKLALLNVILLFVNIEVAIVTERFHISVYIYWYIKQQRADGFLPRALKILLANWVYIYTHHKNCLWSYYTCVDV